MNLKAGNSAKNMNPIICADFPEPDVIRVGDTYYMICATMHFFPGGTLLKSYDLVHWEIAAHVFERLDDGKNEASMGSIITHLCYLMKMGASIWDTVLMKCGY